MNRARPTSCPASSDPRLCTAIVDRLTFDAAIIETGTHSYRLAPTKARAEQAATVWCHLLPLSRRGRR
jgi:hypothetical protein